MELDNRQDDKSCLEVSKNEPLSDSIPLKDSDNDIEPQHETASIVSFVINERGKEFFSIHSNKSMTRLIMRSHQKLESQKQIDPSFASELELRPPVVVIHRDDEGARIAETKNLNKLPFKNRNPAI